MAFPPAEYEMIGAVWKPEVVAGVHDTNADNATTSAGQLICRAETQGE